MACGSVGGAIEKAVPAAAALELFHTWTLVHDDIIDNDATRRGGPTVHEAMAKRYSTLVGLDASRAREYGRDLAILAGDLQHGWAITLLLECFFAHHVEAETILALVRQLDGEVLANVMEGEVLDVQYAMMSGESWQTLSEAEIVRMLWLKTGAVYSFAGLAGAMIGREVSDPADGHAAALAEFASKCGLAFQLQDDVLGIVGDRAVTGKPVGSDIREGKKTVIVLEALKHADAAQRAQILAILGSREASDAEVERVTRLLRDLGGIDRARVLARGYVDEALPHLDVLPPSDYKRLLEAWAGFVIARIA
jgi:geranylgeranyl diphosphate synthase type I